MTYDKDGRDKEGKIGVGDLPRVRPADATTLMVHHLMLASAYYEATPDGAGADAAFIAELQDQVGVLGMDDPAYAGAWEFYTAVKFAHERIKKEMER